MPALDTTSSQSTQLTQQQPGGLMDFIQRAASDKSFDVQKFGLLLDMQERAEKRVAEAAFNCSMLAAQSEIQPVVKNRQNSSTHSTYADLEIIDAAIRPIYMRHGFCMTFNSPSTDETGVTVSCSVLHSAGFSREYSLSGALDTMGPKGTGNKTPIQGLVSSTSYLQRVLTRMIWNVPFKGADKDGNREASDLISEQQVNQIYDMIAACEMNDKARQTFLEIAGVGSVDAIPKTSFTVLYNTLRARLKAKEAR